MTSGTRVAVSRHCGQAKVDLVDERAVRIERRDWSCPVSSVSSAREPTTGEVVRRSQRQIGSGVPQ